MNQQQIKYLKERIEDIYIGKCSDITEKYSVKETSLQKKDKLAQIRNGKAKLRSDNEIGSYICFDSFIYEGEEKLKAAAQKAKEKVNSEVAKLEDVKTRLIDELMLGDAEEAVAKLAKFENYKV